MEKYIKLNKVNIAIELSFQPLRISVLAYILINPNPKQPTAKAENESSLVDILIFEKQNIVKKETR